MRQRLLPLLMLILPTKNSMIGSMMQQLPKMKMLLEIKLLSLMKNIQKREPQKKMALVMQQPNHLVKF